MENNNNHLEHNHHQEQHNHHQEQHNHHQEQHNHHQEQHNHQQEQHHQEQHSHQQEQNPNNAPQCSTTLKDTTPRPIDIFCQKCVQGHPTPDKPHNHPLLPPSPHETSLSRQEVFSPPTNTASFSYQPGGGEPIPYDNPWQPRSIISELPLPQPAGGDPRPGNRYVAARWFLTRSEADKRYCYYCRKQIVHNHIDHEQEELSKMHTHKYYKQRLHSILLPLGMPGYYHLEPMKDLLPYPNVERYIQPLEPKPFDPIDTMIRTRFLNDVPSWYKGTNIVVDADNIDIRARSAFVPAAWDPEAAARPHDQCDQ